LARKFEEAVNSLVHSAVIYTMQRCKLLRPGNYI